MMQKYFVILTIALISCFQGHSQPWKTARYEVFGGLTGLQYFGDIGGTADETNLFGLKDINLLKLRPGITGGLRYHISKPFQVKATFTSGFLAQADLGSKNEGRNFSFLANVNELAAVAEYYIIKESDENYYYSIMQVRGGLRHYRQPLSLYVFAGLGGLMYFVMPNESLESSPRYVGSKHFTMVIPGGIGIKYAIMPKISVNAELGGRFSFTDYLDGYTSPFSDFNDVYYSFAVGLNYKFQQSKGTQIGIRRRRYFF